MYTISININMSGEGYFALNIGNKTVGRIEINLSGNELVLLDTIIHSSRYIHSVTNRLLHEIVEYARMHELKIITISKFVQKQFSSNPALYADVWEKV
jgi:hypothetical protein